MTVPIATSRVATALAALVALLSVVVFFLRAASVWEISSLAPGVAITSGFEQESFYALWRVVHGGETYPDPHRVPFAASYFNWLFYAGYAAPVGLAVQVAGDAAIPLAGRLVTALGAACGAVVLFFLLGRAAASPVIAAAVALLLVSYRCWPLRAALGLALLAFAAWSMKQTYVFGLLALVAFLLVRRQWRAVAVVVSVSLCLWIATFALAGPAFRAAFRDTAATNVFSLSTGLANVRDMLQKTAPLWLIALLFAFRFRRPISAPPLPPAVADLRLLGLLGLAISLPLAFLGACKIGAASNYYFTAVLFLTLFAAAAFHAWPALAPYAFAAMLTLQALVATGAVGQLRLRASADEQTSIWQVWSRAPEPRFSSRTALNVPWLNPGSPPLVLAYNYEPERAAARHFESGGLGGLVASGYFRSLLLPSSARGHCDGADANLRYEPVATVADLTVFRRKSDSSPPPAVPASSETSPGFRDRRLPAPPR